MKKLMMKKKYLYYSGIFALLLVLFFNYFIFDKMHFITRLPEGFIYLSEVDPSIEQDVRYATNNNFTGKVVPGYHKETIILTKEAAESLSKAQQSLAQYGFGLKIFDGYRPTRAVESFVAWSKTPDDLEIKSRYYPGIEKNSLLGTYIMSESSHSRGSTVDVTIIDLKSKKELDMGTEFDFFGPESNTDFLDLSEDIKSNRALLAFAMEASGFKGYKYEWWHFTLTDEKFTRSPEDHFDFIVK